MSSTTACPFGAPRVVAPRGAAPCAPVKELEPASDAEPLSGRRSLAPRWVARLPPAAAAAALLAAGAALATLAASWAPTYRGPSWDPAAASELDATVEMHYKQVYEGSCRVHGLSPIMKRAVCEAAARALHLPDITAEVSLDPDRPEGCYYVNGVPGSGLWLGSSPRSRGKGAGISSLGHIRRPICSDSARAVGLATPKQGSHVPHENPTLAPRTAALDGGNVEGNRSRSDGGGVDDACHDTVPGEECYKEITWAIQRGVSEHPEWYRGLTPFSPRAAFQMNLYRKHIAKCRRPCHWPLTQAELDAREARNDEDCYFEYNGGPGDECFCNLAGNTACQPGCHCPQGCGSTLTWMHDRSVTFRNRALALNCALGAGPAPALLTIPRSYFSQIKFLKTWCPHGMKPLLEEMLREGFRTHLAHAGPAPLRQCIHAATSISMNWFHLHTFCHLGTVDNMPAPANIAWCQVMNAESEAGPLADQVIAWAIGLYGPVPATSPTNCSAMECGMFAPKHHCSCNAQCVQFGDCCPDYQQVCAHNIFT